MKIYVAGFFDDRLRLRAEADKLWHMGHEITSTWLNETSKLPEMSNEEFGKKLAIKDLAEIHSADLIIVDTIGFTPRGGREVEFGYALGRHQQKLAYIVGPPRNIFHQLADKHFTDWSECITYIEALCRTLTQMDAAKSATEPLPLPLAGSTMPLL